MGLEEARQLLAAARDRKARAENPKERVHPSCPQTVVPAGNEVLRVVIFEVVLHLSKQCLVCSGFDEHEWISHGECWLYMFPVTTEDNKHGMIMNFSICIRVSYNICYIVLYRSIESRSNPATVKKEPAVVDCARITPYDSCSEPFGV